MTVTRFGLIRHAQTAWNVEHRIMGRTDMSLAPAGDAQARAWARRLKTGAWDLILCSSLQRTRETGTSIRRTLQVPMVSSSSLVEQHWGDWTGHRIRQLRQDGPALVAAQEAAGWSFCPPGGEDRRTVWRRGRQALLDAARTHAGKTILTVTHEGVIKCLIYGLSRRRFLPTEPALIRPRHLHWLCCNEEELRLEQVNALKLE